MKAKKALRKLVKIEESLSDVMSRYDQGQDGFKEHLQTAKESIAVAKKTLDSEPPASLARRTPAQRPKHTPAQRKGSRSASSR